MGFINVSNSLHFLKLRHNWRASDQFRIELGLDYCVNNNTTKPWAGVSLLFDAEKSNGWAVEANTDWAVLCTPRIDIIPFTDKISLPVDARIGRDWYEGGSPHIEVGIHNAVVALALGIIALASKHPIHLKRKEMGGFYASMPMKFRNGAEVPHTLQQRAEIDASLRRDDRGLQLDLHQLNAVLRLRQD